jgi:hypothetical protein
VLRGGALLFELTLPQAGSVEMSLYDVAGRRAASSGERTYAPGRRTIEWQPAQVRPGVYFVRFTINGEPKADNRIVMLQ